MQGKTIIVTGAASGIGAETAKLLTERGANVIALDRNPVTENCVQYIPIDLMDEASIINAVAQIDGNPDALCNIAGVPPTVAPDIVLKVNVTGTILFTEQVVEKLNDGASIVNVASLAGAGWRQSLDRSNAIVQIKSMDGITEEDCYEFSKEAVIVWTKKCWNTWSDRDIRVNSVSPSATKTPILQDFMETVAARLKKKAPGMEGLPGPGAPEDVATAIAFLCSDDSKWVRGVDLVVDGGLFAARMGQAMGF